MSDDVYLTILFDYYQTLLSDKDRVCFSYYYFDNLSLQEISSELSISRNAVHKRLKKIESELFDLESKLSLYKKEQKILNLIDDIELKEKVKKIMNL